jgi:hypothetical protein
MGSVNKGLWFGMLIVASSATTSEKPALTLLYHRHRWFELRKAIRPLLCIWVR